MKEILEDNMLNKLEAIRTRAKRYAPENCAAQLEYFVGAMSMMIIDLCRRVKDAEKKT